MQFHFVVLFILSYSNLPTSVHGLCDGSAVSSIPAVEADNGCSYGACGGESEAVSDWTCAYDESFCAESRPFRSAADVEAAGGTCRCTDLLNFPQLIGVCNSMGVMSPMAVADDCKGGSAICPANSDGVFSTGDTDHPFTACDLPCFHDNGHRGQVLQDTYQGCEFPSFEWATTSSGTAGSMAGGNNILSTVIDGVSTIIVAGEIYGDTIFSGPFTNSNPTGIGVTSFNHSVPLDSARRPWDAAFLWVNAETGEPYRVVSAYNPDTAYVHGFGIGGGPNNNDIMALGGEFAAGNNGMRAETQTCTPMTYNDGGAETRCEDGMTALKPHETGWPGFIIAADPSTGTIRWMIQAPWLQLSDQELLAGRTLYEHSVLGIRIGSDSSMYVTGFKALTMKEGQNPPAGEPDIKYTGVACKISGTDGSEIWCKDFPELKYAIKSDLEESDNAFYFTGEMTGGQAEGGELGERCENPVGDGGCSLLIRLSTLDGSVEWVRSAHGFYDRPWESSEVHLAKSSDGPYIYAAFQGAGSHGPTTLDTGTSYAVCRATDGTVVPEYDDQFANMVLDQAACTSAGLGTYHSRTSDFAVPAYAANTRVHCMGYEGDSCLVKYNKHNGLPIWGSTSPRINSFAAQEDGITLVGNDESSLYFDTVEQDLDDYQVWISKMTLDGEGLSVTGIHAHNSYSGGCALVEDINNDIFMSFYFASSKARLGPGGSESWTIDVCGDDPDSTVCSDIETQRLTVAKLGDMIQPSCIDSCSGGGLSDFDLKPNTCFVRQVCYEDGGDAEFKSRPCQMCDSSKSQRNLVDKDVGTEYCFIDGICQEEGKGKSTWGGGAVGYIDSECEFCRPTSSGYEWTVAQGYQLNADGECAKAVTLCFPGDSMVETEDSGMIRLEDLKIGDKVNTGDSFETVYSFGHYLKASNTEYLQLQASSGKSMTVSGMHMVFTENGAVAAERVLVGDKLVISNGSLEEVVAIKSVRSSGAYAPFTSNGKIVVDGFMASNYVSLNTEPKLMGLFDMQFIAHISQAPHRLACKWNFESWCANETYSPDGLSTWIRGPLHAAKLFLEQNVLVQSVTFVPVFAFFSVFGLIEAAIIFMEKNFIFIATVALAGIISYHQSSLSKKKNAVC